MLVCALLSIFPVTRQAGRLPIKTPNSTGQQMNLAFSPKPARSLDITVPHSNDAASTQQSSPQFLLWILSLLSLSTPSHRLHCWPHSPCQQGSGFPAQRQCPGPHRRTLAGGGGAEPTPTACRPAFPWVFSYSQKSRKAELKWTRASVSREGAGPDQLWGKVK